MVQLPSTINAGGMLKETVFEVEGLVSTLEVFTDCTCPWCYFMTQNIARLRREYLFQLRRRAFPFRSNVPETGIPVEMFFSDDPLVLQERAGNLEAAAEEAGVPFHVPKTIYNSRRAQEAAVWAESLKKGDAFFSALYKAYFVDGKNISDIPTLADIADSADLPGRQLPHILAAGVFQRVVDEDWSLAAERNILVLPTFMVGNERLVGAHPFSRLSRFARENGIPVRMMR